MSASTTSMTSSKPAMTPSASVDRLTVPEPFAETFAVTVWLAASVKVTVAAASASSPATVKPTAVFPALPILLLLTETARLAPASAVVSSVKLSDAVPVLLKASVWLARWCGCRRPDWSA